MTTLARIKVRWAGAPGGAGVSTFYCLDPATWRPGLAAWLLASKGDLPTAVTLTLEAEGDLFDDVTGTITGAWASGTSTDYTGGSTDKIAAPAGVCLTWMTTAVADGKHLRGRTFLVPVGTGAFDTNGTLTSAALSAFLSRANTLVSFSPGQFMIWHRPIAAGKPHGPRAGSSAAVSAVRVADKVAVLRSRRD